MRQLPKRRYASLADCLNNIRSHAPQCFVCRSRSLDASICPSCRRRVSFTHFYAPFSYKDLVIREMVHQVKYKNLKDYGKILGMLISDVVLRFKVNLPKESIVIPTPSHSSHLRDRGFNQSKLLAKKFSDLALLPLESRILIRNKKTKSQ